MLTALKAKFDDSEAGSLYRYVCGWVEYGNPARAYRELIYLMQGFTDLCDQYGIEYWADWGTLLGYLRHDGGAIPWDYDHDFGMMTDQYERFIAVVEKLQAEQATAPATAAAATPTEGVNSHCTFALSDFTFKREGERGYYVMSLASHPDIQIDIVEYTTRPNSTPGGEEILVHNMDAVTYEGFFYPDMPRSMVFPLKRVQMLGCSTLIPNDSDAVTKLHFGNEYMKVLWVPYLLTKLYNPLLTATLWQPPVRSVPIVASYQEGFARYGATSPFLVRRPPEFAHITRDSLLAFASTCDQTAFGYDAAGEIVDGRTVKDLAREWAEDRLTTKVLDSPLACCDLPADFIALDQEPPSDATEPAASDEEESAHGAAVAKNAGLGLMLTRANAYTFMHLDPPMYGGGWMYLAAGRKSWTYLSPEYLDLLYDPTTKRLRDLPVSELATQFGYRLHGQILHATAEAGDLCYFPPCWMHRVRTYEKAIGVSGYMKLPQAHASMARYTKKLDQLGLTSVWNGNPNI